MIKSESNEDDWASFFSKNINRFIEMGILVPKDKDKKYGQSYIYKKYTDIFAE